MSELKPCPFCGGEAEVLGETKWSRGAFVGCLKCRATIDRQATEAEAIEAWNTRTHPESEVMLMGDRVFINGHGHYAKERTCRSTGGSDFFFCSECDYLIEIDELWSYCPNCGAKVVRE